MFDLLPARAGRVSISAATARGFASKSATVLNRSRALAQRPMLALGLAIASALATLPGSAAAAAESLAIESMTSTELQHRVESGTDMVLVPIGGTEQNGPHMVLGKHNRRVERLAETIAERVGHAVVAPVLAYVPEGSISPPAAHMRWTGTISIPESAFEAVLEATAKSFAQHGFAKVVFLGDHGGYQRSLERVAARLNKEWQHGGKCRALALLDYYRVTQTAYVAALEKRGYTAAEIGTHAGLADTSLAMAVDPGLVRAGKLDLPAADRQRLGVAGDPRRASAELGQAGIDLIVESSLAALRAWTARAH